MLVVAVVLCGLVFIGRIGECKRGLGDDLNHDKRNKHQQQATTLPKQ